MIALVGRVIGVGHGVDVLGRAEQEPEPEQLTSPAPGVRDAAIAASDDELLRQCEVDRYRASGPGGQHRNKTESAVRTRSSMTPR